MENKQSPMLRTSERKDFKRCPQRWWWGWREGLKPNGASAAPLWFGTGWHLVMEHWYQPGNKRGSSPLQVWRDYIAEETIKIRTSAGGDKFDETEFVDAGALGEAMIGGYIDTYGQEEWMRVIQPEHPFEVIITDIDGNPRVLYCGKYDGIYVDERTDDVWILEHKTAAQIITSHLALDDQAGSYVMIAERQLKNDGLISKSQHVKGIMYNFVRKAMPDSRPRNADGLYTNKPTKTHYQSALEDNGIEVSAKDSLATLEDKARSHNLIVLGDVSKSQPPSNFLREPVARTVRERNGMLRRLRAEVEAMELYRSRSLPLFKNPTRDCSWDCPFYNMCVMHEQGGDNWKDMRDTMFHREDPYAEHRDSLEENK